MPSRFVSELEMIYYKEVALLSFRDFLVFVMALKVTPWPVTV